ncbi:MAG: hypothetical protein ACREA2_14445 [Blastocatellia bacterium]
MRAASLIAQAGDAIIATPDGVAALGPDFEPLPVGEELQAYWLDRLPEGERRILEILLNYYPHAVDREVISDATDYKRSSRDTYLQRLSARRLIEEDASQNLQYRIAELEQGRADAAEESFDTANARADDAVNLLHRSYDREMAAKACEARLRAALEECEKLTSKTAIVGTLTNQHGQPFAVYLSDGKKIGIQREGGAAWLRIEPTPIVREAGEGGKE